MHSEPKVLKALAVVAFVFAMAFAGLIAQSTPVKADHDTAPWGPNPFITGTGTLSNYTAAMLNDGQGHLYVFRFYTTAAGNNLFVYKYQDAGANPSPVLYAGFPVQVNGITNVVDYQFAYPTAFASAAMDHAGNIYVAWTHTNTGATLRDVYVSRSTDGGKTWALTTMVNAATAQESDQWPSIVATPDGTLYVAWVQNMGAWWNITVSHSTDQANTWSSQMNITERSNAGSTVYPPSMAVDSLGRVYVAYTRLGSRDYANLTWSDNGSTWVAPVNLNSGTTQSGWAPTVAVDAQNRVHVAWEDARTTFSGVQEIFYVRSSDRGASWTPQTPISQGLAPFAGSNDVQVASEGDTLLVTWDVYGPTTPDAFDQSYAISADHGGSWYPEQIKSWGGESFGSYLARDRNGTFYLGTTIYAANERMAFSWWHSPPSSPVIASVTPGTNSLTVSWSASPEADIASYRLLRSPDGSSYSVVANVAAGTTTFADTGLANGTYWYKLEAVDTLGYVSHDSVAVSGTVGPTTQQLIDALNAQIASLQAEITSLQGQLSSTNASLQAELAAAQAQITSLQNALTSLQNSQTTSNAATAAALARLQANITDLQGQLNNLQSQQATQTISYANLAFEVIVVVLLVVLLLNQMRKPKSPQMMMAEPAQAPKKPEDDL